VPVDWQDIRDKRAPLAAYQGSHSTVRKQLQRDLGRLRELGLSARYDAGHGEYSLDEDSRRPRRVKLTGPQHIIVHQTGRDVPLVSEESRTLAMAAWQRRVTSFTYRHIRGEQHLVRHIEPWGLYSRRGRWYLVGRCQRREAVPTFRVSLIEELRVPDLLTAGAQFDPPADFNIQEQANQEPWDWEVHEPVDVGLRASGGLSFVVARRLQGRIDGDDVHRSVTNTDAVWELMCEWLPRVRIAAPPELAQVNDTWFSDIAARHGGARGASS
jgi:predicted DNA-binding transcriptional regulator YafY